MVGKKVVHHLMMSAKDAHYVGGLVNGARIVDQWGDVGTELMVYVDGDISLFLGYENIEFLAPVYVGDFMEYHGWIEKVGNQSYTHANLKHGKLQLSWIELMQILAVLQHLVQQLQHVNLLYCVVEQQVACILQKKTREVLRKLLSKIENILVKNKK